MKDPNTGKRISRMNPPETWKQQEVPALRIIDEELWQAAKDRQNGSPYRTAKTSKAKLSPQQVGFSITSDRAFLPVDLPDLQKFHCIGDRRNDSAYPLYVAPNLKNFFDLPCLFLPAL